MRPNTNIPTERKIIMTEWLFGLVGNNHLLFGLSTDGNLVELVDGQWIKPIHNLLFDDWKTATRVDEEELRTRFHVDLPHTVK
jgi:hypothetical protein